MQWSDRPGREREDWKRASDDVNDGKHEWIGCNTVASSLQLYPQPSQLSQYKPEMRERERERGETVGGAGEQMQIGFGFL